MKKPPYNLALMAGTIESPLKDVIGTKIEDIFLPHHELTAEQLERLRYHYTVITAYTWRFGEMSREIRLVLQAIKAAEVWSVDLKQSAFRFSRAIIRKIKLTENHGRKIIFPTKADCLNFCISLNIPLAYVKTIIH